MMASRQESKVDWNRVATYEDANLLLRLYELRREDKLRKARAWFVAECKPKSKEEWEQLCPVGSENNAYYRMVTTYWEMACGMVTGGVLHPELFIQNSLEHLLVWIRIRHIVPEIRKSLTAPHQLRNLEAVAAMAQDWLAKQGEGAFESFEARFKP
jgi:hypothetical protein